MENLRIGTAYEFVDIEFRDGLNDEGWIATRAEIVVDGFRADIRPWFHALDFVNFERSLRKLHETLEGEANLEPLEGQLVLNLKAGTGGHIELEGHAGSGFGNRLSFEIAMDQSYLPETLRVLQRIRDSATTG